MGKPLSELRELNPRPVVVSITGFGQGRPPRGLPEYNVITHAMSGLIAASGPVGGGPESALGDFIPGLDGACGALAALYERQGTESTDSGSEIGLSSM